MSSKLLEILKGQRVYAFSAETNCSKNQIRINGESHLCILSTKKKTRNKTTEEPFLNFYLRNYFGLLHLPIASIIKEKKQ